MFNLRESLMNVFGLEFNKGMLFVSWHMKELKLFTDDELRELHKTATHFGNVDSKLASTLKQRLGVEWYRRLRGEALTKPKIKTNKPRRKHGKNKATTR